MDDFQWIDLGHAADLMPAWPGKLWACRTCGTLTYTIHQGSPQRCEPCFALSVANAANSRTEQFA